MVSWRRALPVLSAIALVAGLAAPATAQAPRSPAECAAALDCTAAEIDLMSMAQRLEFVRAMQSGPASALGAMDRWRNIEGVITFFRDRGLGSPGTWVSYVDAGIVEGIERGIAIALGRSTDGFGNPGSARWASYLTRLSRGELAARSAHDRAWSEAEQAATDHGIALAAAHGQFATPVEQRFFQFSEVYRWTLRNRPFALDLLFFYGPLIHPDLAGQRVPFYDWFTDVAESAPSYKGCEIGYGFAQLHPIVGVFGIAGLFLAYVTELFEEYRAAMSD
ncbi:hypothetical protein [Actinophytocola sp.]|uniref:hypothetical protein n=1 Tax=Actinophytocola sp. TaxID=1872138 RepID=UPI002D7E861B|nr:hypothetical protein [Actinophytocola sp.]HET9143836.1 hypothetical protein [Actinophytocola sp.]